MPAIDVRKGPFIENPIEAALLVQMVDSLLDSGVKESDIGVISPYRNQLRILSRLLVRHQGIEVVTHKLIAADNRQNARKG